MSWDGKLFYVYKHAAVKLLSSKLLCVRGTTNVGCCLQNAVAILSNKTSVISYVCQLPVSNQTWLYTVITTCTTAYADRLLPTRNNKQLTVWWLTDVMIIVIVTRPVTDVKRLSNDAHYLGCITLASSHTHSHFNSKWHKKKWFPLKQRVSSYHLWRFELTKVKQS